MAKQLDPAIGDVLKRYGFTADACWDCHGTWVVYHRVLEQIAAKASIAYDKPDILVAEKDAAAILVSGSLDGKSEWSIGEAAIGQNYKVSGKQAAYPFAMAEKRGKDRVILKLIGLHGLAYSEEEADDFKNGAPDANEQPPAKQPPAQKKDEPQKGEPADWREYAAGLKKAILTSPNEAALDDVLDVNRENMAKLKTISQPASDALDDAINSRRATLQEAA